MTGLLPSRVLVTGGAGGIGSATARILREGGSAVALVDLPGRILEEQASVTGATPVGADLADPTQAKACVAEAAEALGGVIEGVVLAAGMYVLTPSIDVDVAAWDRVLAVNLRSSLLVAREVARALFEHGHPGAMVFVSSIAAVQGDRDEPSVHYSATKAGLIGVTRQLAAEWSDRGIRSNVVCPGLIDTPMLRRLDDPERAARFLEERVGLGRLGRPEEVAEVIAFLLSSAASYVNGSTVMVDGGLHAM
jgi:NAD(P)-dependent dehydrogenase (short-subunit alcohol dehydrogenase family)